MQSHRHKTTDSDSNDEHNHAYKEGVLTGHHIRLIPLSPHFFGALFCRFRGTLQCSYNMEPPSRGTHSGFYITYILPPVYHAGYGGFTVLGRRVGFRNDNWDKPGEVPV